MADDIGMRLGAWLPLVRGARIPLELKAAALVFASYANADGTGITCSSARLAVDLDVDLRTAGRRLKWLREVGLVEMTKRGNRRRGRADEYRLTAVPEVTNKYLETPDPAAYRKLIGELAEGNRRASAARMRAKRERDREASVTDSPSESVTPEPDEAVDNPVEDVQGAETVTDTQDGSNSEVLRTTGDGVTDNPNALTCDLVSTPPMTRTLHGHIDLPCGSDTGKSPSYRPHAREASTDTDFAEVANDFDDALTEARAALSALEDKGVALRAAVRAELGADAPPDEVILLAYERARRRRAG